MTYKEFLNAYEAEVDILEVCDVDGVEIGDEIEIPDDTKVIGFSRRSGMFDVMVDICHEGLKKNYAVHLQTS